MNAEDDAPCIGASDCLSTTHSATCPNYVPQGSDEGLRLTAAERTRLAKAGRINFAAEVEAVEGILADRLAAANTHAIECERIGVKAIEDRIMTEAALATARRRLAAVEALADKWADEISRGHAANPEGHGALSTHERDHDELRAALAKPSAAQGDSTEPHPQGSN